VGRARVYRNIALQSSYVGLELSDLFLLGFIGWFLLMFNPGALGINSLALVLVYFVIRIGKRGKAPGYTLDLLRYSFARRAFLATATPDTEGRLHPFTATENFHD
jgi:hypothetical protein